MACHVTPPQSTKLGFSLVELSIVLVILGLLVGGVLSGQALIRAAELRSVTTDVSRFGAALLTFRDKYFALPGDMNNATQFWGTAAGNGSNAACGSFQSTTKATCNGDGDGLIEYTGGIQVYEDMRAWQHLANAGLIEGQYDGTYLSTGPQLRPGKNVPPSKFGNNIWWVASDTDQNVMLGLYQTDWGPLVLTPEEAWNVDTKLDDGKPSSGRIYSWGNNVGECVSAAGAYVLTNKAKYCALEIYPYQ